MPPRQPSPKRPPCEETAAQVENETPASAAPGGAAPGELLSKSLAGARARCAVQLASLGAKVADAAADEKKDYEARFLDRLRAPGTRAVIQAGLADGVTFAMFVSPPVTGRSAKSPASNKAANDRKLVQKAIKALLWSLNEAHVEAEAHRALQNERLKGVSGQENPSKSFPAKLTAAEVGGVTAARASASSSERGADPASSDGAGDAEEDRASTGADPSPALPPAFVPDSMRGRAAPPEVAFVGKLANSDRLRVCVYLDSVVLTEGERLPPQAEPESRRRLKVVAGRWTALRAAGEDGFRAPFLSADVMKASLYLAQDACLIADEPPSARAGRPAKPSKAHVAVAAQAARVLEAQQASAAAVADIAATAKQSQAGMAAFLELKTGIAQTELALKRHELHAAQVRVSSGQRAARGLLAAAIKGDWAEAVEWQATLGVWAPTTEGAVVLLNTVLEADKAGPHAAALLDYQPAIVGLAPGPTSRLADPAFHARFAALSGH